jgi:hypothetical protein
MAGTKSTTTTTTTTTKTTKTKRLTQLVAEPGKLLSSLEESVVRMHHGISIKPEAALTSNAVNLEVAEDMEDIEIDAYVETGRIEALGAVPKEGASKPQNDKTAKILDGLKDK